MIGLVGHVLEQDEHTCFQLERQQPLYYCDWHTNIAGARLQENGPALRSMRL